LQQQYYKEENMNYDQTETLKEVVNTTTELKKWLVNYVGEKHDPENGEVTVEMIVETMAIEFPEFLMAIAEENWVRGYHQALDDVDTGKNVLEELEQQNA
jgi:uncharacterized iron-regulated protein|tara:strand:+ start:205 stop:504 length:300 start_codon:yes stop_codon:yes gene_type:complete